MTRLSLWLAWASAAAMILVWFLVAGIGDLVWWTLPLVYGPRWAAAGLLMGLLPALLLATRRALPAVLVTILVFTFGVMDFQLPWGRVASPRDYAVRVLEMNTGGAVSDTKLASILSEIARVQPQIIVIAECSASVADGIRAMPGWRVERTESRQCFGTNLPIVAWEPRHPGDFWKMNGSGGIGRAILDTPAGKLRVGLVHLETPREALEEYMDLSSIPTLGDITRHNIELRELESTVARDWIFAGDPMPTIVVGDFNLPVSSAIYRRHWSDLNNAFSSVGFGLGHTKHMDFWGSRIDHILTTDEFVVANVQIGNDVESDHWPLYADLTIASALGTTASR